MVEFPDLKAQGVLDGVALCSQRPVGPDVAGVDEVAGGGVSTVLLAQPGRHSSSWARVSEQRKDADLSACRDLPHFIRVGGGQR
jgi:hypothetical protein